MSTATLHFVSQNASGYGPTDGRYLPCIGASKPALPQIKFVPVRCSSRRTFSVSSAAGSSGGYRRNPDFSRQNKNGGYSRNRIRQNDEINGSDGLEESEFFSSKNGPLLSVSGGPKFQATASPGPREREIVELFRKVQAQLRERNTVKVEKKIEETQGRDKESGTVDSLLKLLRKHTTQPGKRNSSNGATREFVVDHYGQNGKVVDETRTSSVDDDVIVKEESPAPSFRRPPSKFERRSPVPQVRYRPIQPEVLEPELEPEPEPETEAEPELEPERELVFQKVDVFDRMTLDEGSDIEEVFSDEEEEQEEEEEEEEEEEKAIVEDLSTMKLTELRALAKSRGLKGFSKLKKVDLVELLVGGGSN